MATVCTNCGFNNPPGMRFCGNCGRRFVDAASQTKTPQISSTAHETPVADPERLGVMSGSGLLERFRKAGLETRAQRRSVTVLFVDLSGYTMLSEQLSDEALFELVQKFIQLLVNNVYKYEGMVDKLTGDGLMALFGAPVAHENDTERAIRCAMDMMADVAKLSRDSDLGGRELHIHVGINYGPVIVGSLGTDAMMNYTAIGDAVNLARRLEEAAGPDTILVSESIYRQTYRLFDFETLPPMPLKNVSREVNAFRVIGSKDRPGSVRGLEGLRAPMIGRENEFRGVQNRVDHLINDHQGGVILLMGEGGMGKSRLTSELKARLDYNKVRVLEGQSLTYRKSIAYWIFQDMFRAYLGLKADSPEADVRLRLSKAVHSLLGDSAADKLAYLEHMLSLEPSDPAAAGRLRYLDASQLRQQIFLAVRDFLVAEARQKPLLLILEDLHWADEGSLELIRFLIDTTRTAPVLIYAITRPLEGGAVKAIHERAQQRLGDRYLSIRLQALPPELSNQLLEALMSIPDLPASLRDQIIQRSAGLPFYLEEILRMLIEDHIINRSVDETGAVQWRLTPGADVSAIGVPETLQGLILTRFDRLPPIQRRVLQTASVVGYRFDGQVLQRVLEVSPEPVQKDEIDWVLHLLVEREFIAPQSNTGILGGNRSYQFKHVLVSDAVYSKLLQRDRRDLHTLVGQSIEQIYADRIDGQIEVLASHFLRSELQERALHYLILAGKKAARSFANEQARQHFTQALEILPKVNATAAQAVYVHLGLGDALLTAGEYLTAREHFIRALDGMGISKKTGFLPPMEELESPKEDLTGDDRVRVLCLLNRKIGQTHERQGDYEKALVCLRSARSLVEHRTPAFSADLASVLNDIAFIDFRRGSLDRAEELLGEALKLAESVEQLDLLASILNRIAGIYFQRNQVDTAARYLFESLTLREKIGDDVGVARSYNNLGLLDWKQGDLDGAIDNFNHCYKLQSNLGDVEGLIVLHTNIGLIELDRGNMAESERHFQEALETAGDIGHFYYVCFSRMHLALWNVYTKNWRKVIEHGNLGLLGFQELGVQENQLDLNVSLGWAYHGINDQVHLQEVLQRINDLLQKELEKGPGKTAEGSGRALRLLAQIAREKGDFPKAQHALEKSAEIFAQYGNLMERGRSLVDLASLLCTCGERQRSKALLAEAHDVFAMMGAKIELGRLQEVEKSLGAC